MSGIKIGCSPISHVIYAGRVLKSGLWGAGKTDVTSTATGAVAEYLRGKDEAIIYTFKDGTKWRLSCVKVQEPKKEEKAKDEKEITT